MNNIEHEGLVKLVLFLCKKEVIKINYEGLKITEQLIRYCHYCLEDKVISKYENYTSCKLHKKACQRFLDDLERAKREDCPFEWREEEVEKVVRFALHFKHSKGALANQKIDLRSNGHQLFFFGNIYGFWLKENNSRRFKRSFLELGRKNAKSMNSSIMAAYDMSVLAMKTHEIAEVVCCATKRDQARIVFDECVNMIMNSDFKLKFKSFKATNRLVHLKSQSFFKPLSKDDGKRGDGGNFSLQICDEIHQHPDSTMIDLFAGAIRPNRLLSMVTTAGRDLNSYAYRVEYPYAKKILLGEVKDDSQFCDIMEIDENDDPFDESCWVKANPIRLCSEDGWERFREEVVKAKENEETKVNFLTKMLNKWVESKENGYMNIKKFERQMIEKIPFDLKGRDVYIGFDLSAKVDLTSVVFLFPYQTDKKDDFGNKIVQYYSYHHSFIANEENMKRKIRQDHFPYDLALRNGFLSLTNSEIVDQSFVLQWVLDELERIGIDPLENATFVFDPANASKSIMDLQNYIKEGLIAKGKSAKKAQEIAETRVIECYQSYQSLNEATNGYREQIYMGNAFWVNDPLMKFSMVNAVVKQNDGKIKIDKNANTHRIDPVDALLCAFKLALYHIFKNKNNVKKYYDVFLED